MWLVTDQGFLSTVAYDPSKDRHNKRSNRQLKSYGARPVLVRARREEHLFQLKPYWSKLRIEKDEYADYTYRAVMPRARWVAFLADAGDKIDYDSHFKEAVRDRCPGTKKAVGDFYSALMGVWSKLATIQPFLPYGGYYAGQGASTGKGGGYGSLYSGTGYTAGTGFSSYGGKTFSKGENAPAKSAADSAAVFAGAGWAGRSNTDVEGSMARRAAAPDTVSSLAVMLMTKDPEEIFVDSTADSAVGALFDECVSQFGRKMSAYEVATTLNDLMNEPNCPEYDIDAFYEAYEFLIVNYEMPEVEDDADLEIEKPVKTIDLTEGLGVDDLGPQSIATEAVRLFIGD